MSLPSPLDIGTFFNVNASEGDVFALDVNFGNDISVGASALTNVEAALITDTPGQTDLVTGTSAYDVFVIDGPSGNYDWGPTEDGKGTVVWTAVSYDVLIGVEAIRFRDRDVTLALEPTSAGINGDNVTYHVDVAGMTDHVQGGAAYDVFIINDHSRYYNWNPTDDGQGIVIWNDVGYDVLKGVEAIQFGNKLVDLSLLVFSKSEADLPDPALYLDNPDATDHVYGTSVDDTFAIEGNSTDFSWRATEDGLGTVVWSDNGHDVLKRVETIRFADREVDLATEPESHPGDHSEIAVMDIANVVQHLTGTSDNDVFVIAGDSANYQFGPSESGDKVVVWGDTGYDVLDGFEAIRFADRTVELTGVVQTGPDYFDVVDQIQHLTHANGGATFHVAGAADEYEWGTTDDGAGIVIWTSDSTDNSYDVLHGFSLLTFTDQSVSLI